MKNLVKVDPRNLVANQEVYVYGKLRAVYTDNNFSNFPGRKGAVVNVINDVVVVRFPNQGPIIWKNTLNKNGGAPRTNASFYIRQNKEEAPKKEEVAPIPELSPLEKLREVMKAIRKADMAGDVINLPYNPLRYGVPDHRDVSLFGWVTPKGFYFHQSVICHAGLSNRPVDATHVFSYITTKGKPLTDAGKAYLNWLFNHSPWKEVFTTKDVNEAFDSGIILNVNVPANMMAGACIAARCPTEFPGRCEFWYEAVKCGMNPNLATIFGQWFQVKEGNITYRPYSGHSPFTTEKINEGTIRNFLSGKVVNARQNYMENGGYYGVDCTFDDGAGKVVGASVHQVFKKACLVGQKVDNPFGAVAEVIPVANTYALISALQTSIKY